MQSISVFDVASKPKCSLPSAWDVAAPTSLREGKLKCDLNEVKASALSRYFANERSKMDGEPEAASALEKCWLVLCSLMRAACCVALAADGQQEGSFRESERMIVNWR